MQIFIDTKASEHMKKEPNVSVSSYVGSIYQKPIWPKLFKPGLPISFDGQSNVMWALMGGMVSNIVHCAVVCVFLIFDFGAGFSTAECI